MELARKPLEGARLLHRVQVGALQIFDDGDLHRLLVGDLAQNGGNRRLAGNLRGAPAALAGDELEAAARQRTNQDRLHHSVGGDGGSQLGQLLFVHLRPRLEGVAVDLVERESRAACRLRIRRAEHGRAGQLERAGSRESRPLPRARRLGSVAAVVIIQILKAG